MSVSICCIACSSALLFITKEVRTGTQAGQEAGADAEATEGCSLLAYFRLLSYRTQYASQGMDPPTRGPPTWSLIEKVPHSWISWRHFPNWHSFLCDNSSLCQGDTQNQPVQLTPCQLDTNTTLLSLNPYFLIHPQDVNYFKSPTVFTY